MISDPLLEDMLLCPLMFYGSAREDDMDLDQFAVMFRALYLEGFARPLEGVRVIMRVLLEKYRKAGGERRMKCGVRSIVVRDGRAAALRPGLRRGGLRLARALVDRHGRDGRPDRREARAELTRLGYVETISVLDRAPSELGWGADTIVFFNDSERFAYRNPPGQVDVRQRDHLLPEQLRLRAGPRACGGPPPRHVPGQLRRLGEPARGRLPRRQAALVRRDPASRPGASCRRSAHRTPSTRATVATDMFTPTTVEHYTGHLRGAIYGSPVKNPGGRTALPNVYLCGTDQGMLGIVGSMLSGIAMANQHILMA